jgi:D-psicose/D-tagatose/L-ribulose 3-epimerase
MSQIGINAWVWTSPVTTDEFSRLAPMVARMGFDLIEIGIEGTSDLDYRRGAEIAKANGLRVGVCAAMGPDRDLIHPDESIRKNGMSYVRHCIDAAQTLGSANVCGPLYSAVGRTWQATDDERKRDVDLLVNQLRELATYAAERGVGLGVEPLNRFETSFINLTSQAIEVVDRVGHPGCGLLLDTFHMNIEEQDPAAAARQAGGRIAHVHACGTDRGSPGADVFDWPAFLAAIGDAGYDGPMTIESFTAANEVIATAASIWRPLAESPDSLAADGLRFLRGALAT